MRKILLLGLLALWGSPASAQPAEFTFTIGGGRVTLIADNVPIRTVLMEWARQGQSRIVNAEKVVGPPLTLRLIDVPEDQALDIVLRSASGYMAAPRAVALDHASRYDRIMILASSHPTAAAPAARMPRQMPQPNPAIMQPPPMAVEDDQGDDGTMPQPQDHEQEMPVSSPQPGPLQVTPPGPGQPGGPQPQQLPVTSPRPGFIVPPGQQPPQPTPIKPPDSPDR
jgi:hypothetical protein